MNEDVRRGIGRRLREFRVSLGLTQDEFADELGLSQRQSVSAWELGKAMPKGEEWFKMGVMGMSLDYAVLNIRTVPVASYNRRPFCTQATPCAQPPATAVVPAP